MDIAPPQGIQCRGVQLGGHAGVVGHDLIDLGPGGAEALGDHRPGDIRPQQEASLVRHVVSGKKLIHQRITGEALRHEVGIQTQVFAQRFGRGISHRGQANARQRPPVDPHGGQTLGERAHRVGAGQQQPIVLPNPRDGPVHRGPVGGRHEFQRRRLDHLGPELLQLGPQHRGLMPGPRHQHALAEERPRGEEVQPRLVDRRDPAHHDDRGR